MSYFDFLSSAVDFGAEDAAVGGLTSGAGDAAAASSFGADFQSGVTGGDASGSMGATLGGMARERVMGGGGGGGGGGIGGNPMGGLQGMDMGAKAVAVNDAIEDALLAPDRDRRQRILEITDRIPGSSEGIQPVATSRGGAAMVNAMRENRLDAEQTDAADQYARLGRKMRNLAATQQVAKNSAAIVRRIASWMAGGAGGGMGEIAGGAGGGGGGI